MRISGGGSGNVNILQSDTGQFRNDDFVTAQDGAFMCGTDVTNVSGQYGLIQLYNPAASGVTVLVDAIAVSPYANTTMALKWFNTEADTEIFAWPSLLLDAGAGNAVLRRHNNVALQGSYLGIITLLAFQPYTFRPKAPIEYEEEKGLIVQSLDVNTAFSTTFYGREV